MNNSLTISYIDELNCSLTLDKIANTVQKASVPFVSMNCVNWSDFSYKPKVEFRLVLLKNGFYLEFNVEEKGIRGLVTEDNGPVYEDSCVEFFIDPAGQGSYYNFEFNCLGTLLLGFGQSRHNRELGQNEILREVIRYSSLGNKAITTRPNSVTWNLIALIPFSSFFHHKISQLKKVPLRCNFYKCGDKTLFPHYLSWNPISTEKPDFHRPEFFGWAKA